MYTSTIKLGFGNNLITGHAPHGKVTLRKVSLASRKHFHKEALEQLGLFDANSSNYNTYYPNVKTKDLKPQKKDFIEPVFRALSKVTVHPYTNPVDFSKSSVLKKSLNLLKGSTVNVDHETAVANAIGSVSEVFWQDEYTTENGILVPAGINSRLKIDGKSNPKIARAIMMDPPAIHSTSVTVSFNWEKSHPSMSTDDFFKNLGAFDKSGVLVRRVANMVNRYEEISLVSHGADPFAQKVDKNGKIVNPEYSAVSYNSKDVKSKKSQNYFFFDFKTDIISNSKPNVKKKTIPSKSYNKSQTNGMNKKLALLLATTLGLKAFDDKNPKHLALAEKYIKNGKSAEKLKQKLQDSQEKVSQAETKNKSLTKRYKAAKEFKTEFLSKLRKQTLRNYKLSAKEVDMKVITMIKETDDTTVLEGLNATYQENLSKKFQDKCSDCGSHNITRASASIQEGDEETELIKDPVKFREAISEDSIKNAMHLMHEFDQEEEKK